VEIWETYESLSEFLEDYDPRDEWPEVLDYFEVELEEPEPFDILEDIDVDADVDAGEVWEPGEVFDIGEWEEIAEQYEDYANDFAMFENDS
jgi:hypothetical protein